MTDTTVRIPKRFYDDCVNCDVEDLPPYYKETKNYYVISKIRDEFAGCDYSDLHGKQMNELISRAIYYADNTGFDLSDGYMRGIVLSARATLKALHKADVLTDYEIKLCRQAFGYPAFDMHNPKDVKALQEF